MPAIMLTLDLLLLSPPWTIKFQGALTLSTFLAFAYCKFFLQKSLLSREFAGSIVARRKHRARNSLCSHFVLHVQICKVQSLTTYKGHGLSTPSRTTRRECHCSMGTGNRTDTDHQLPVPDLHPS